ncbi:HEPN domain-containing protein [Haloarcula sp. CGMCC 1.2071]|uniref:ApeA N-terminal domain 1-containing protein n=1 Tax=Haloarcula sp. CGMCC 1.2071 TaxID=3111454 RepID=UPI00300F342B
MDSKTFKGEWWAPDDPEERVAGIIEYMPSGGNAELFGVLGTDLELGRDIPERPIDDLHQGILHGETTDAELITIADAVVAEENNPDVLSDAGISTTRYQFSRIYIGEHFDTEPAFSQFSVSFDGLAEWFGASRVEMEVPDEEDLDEVNLKFYVKEHKEINIDLQSAQLTFFISPGVSSSSQETTLTESVSMNICLDAELTFKEFRNEYLQPLQRYIALATGAPVQPTSITGIDSSNVQGVSILTNIPEFAPGDRSVSPVGILFKPDEVDLEQSIQHWFANESSAEYMFNSYFGIIYNSQLYLEHEFLSLAVALESYFGHKFPDYELMDSGEYRDLREGIVDGIPDDADAKDRIENLLISIGNLPSFSNKLELVIDEFHQVIELFIDWDSTLSQVTDIRHDLAHGLGRDYTSKQVAIARYRLQLIIECILLDIAGIENEHKAKILIQKYQDADFVDFDPDRPPQE